MQGAYAQREPTKKLQMSVQGNSAMQINNPQMVAGKHRESSSKKHTGINFSPIGGPRVNGQSDPTEQALTGLPSNTS